MNTRKTGSSWEDAACRWLCDRGYQILAKNFHCKVGEIDIIAYRQNTIVFVEVKYRKTSSSGYAQEAVPYTKQRKICAAADYFRMKHGITEQYGFRFDVIAINGGQITQYENAFPYTGRF